MEFVVEVLGVVEHGLAEDVDFGDFFEDVFFLFLWGNWWVVFLRLFDEEIAGLGWAAGHGLELVGWWFKYYEEMSQYILFGMRFIIKIEVVYQ